MSSPFVTLNSGHRMPLFGLGTWKASPGEVKQAVIASVKIGYRHIDCAWIYQNQDEVGEAFTELFETGVVTREELFITSKLWNTFHAAGDVEAHCRETLAQLKLDYLDLYLIHWPATNVPGEVLTPSIQETWQAMERIADLGLARSIGVSNFSTKKMRDMRSYARIFPAVNQVELHPLWNQQELFDSCAELGTHLTAYSPLGSPDSARMFGHRGGVVLTNPVIVEIAAEAGKSVAQVCIRWAIQRGTSVIPKSTNAARLQENFDVLNFELTADQMARLNAIQPQERMISGSFLVSEQGPYRTAAQVWDEE